MLDFHVILVGLFVASGMACFASVLRTNQIPEHGSRLYFRLLLIVCGLWSMSVSLQLVLPVEYKIFAYLSGLSLGLNSVFMWVMFTLNYTDSKLADSKVVFYGMIALLVTIISVKLTNSVHGLYFSYTTSQAPFTHIEIDKMMLNYAVTVLAYIGSAYGFYKMYRMYEESPADTRTMKILLLVMFVPVLPEILSFFYLENVFLLFPYEPVGVAMFAIGSLFYLNVSFTKLAEKGVQEAIEIISVPVVSVSSDGIVMYANNTAKERVFDGSEPLTINCMKDSFKKAVSSGERGDLITDDNRMYRLFVTSVELGEKEVVKSYSFVDVTEEEKSIEMLERQRSQLEQLAETSRHYMRNQAGVIGGSVDLLEARKGEEEAIQRAEEATQKLSRLSENISDIISLSNPVSSTEVVSLGTLVESVEAELEVEVSDTEETVVISKDRGFKMIREFASYASKTDADKIRVEKSGDQLILSHNDGSHMAVNTVRAAFEHGEIQSKYINLNTIRAIADSHLWEYRVEQQDGYTCLILSGVEQSNIT